MEIVTRGEPVNNLEVGVLSLHHYIGTARTSSNVNQNKPCHATLLKDKMKVNIEVLTADVRLYGKF